MKVEVYVTLKAGVLDPQGQAVSGTLGRLGYDNVESVRIGKYIVLELANGTATDVAKKRVAEMCDRLLANTVIEDYRIELIGD